MSRIVSRSWVAPDPPLTCLAELKTTFQLPILGVKKNPQSPLYTSLGVLTKGTIIEVNVSELGLVTTGGKVVWSSESHSNDSVLGETADMRQSMRKSPTTQVSRGRYTSCH